MSDAGASFPPSREKLVWKCNAGANSKMHRPIWGLHFEGDSQRIYHGTLRVWVSKDRSGIAHSLAMNSPGS